MTTWNLDPSHSLIEFSVKHMMIATVKGRFSKAEGSIAVDPADMTAAKFDFSVDAASIDTRDEQRDGHLRSADFFDVEQYPKLTFVSKRVERGEGDDYLLVGDLTIHGVTKEVAFQLTYEGQGKDPWGNQRIGFSAESKINRREFGLHWNAALEAGGVLVGEQVKISVQIEAVQQAAQVA